MQLEKKGVLRRVPGRAARHVQREHREGGGQREVQGAVRAAGRAGAAVGHHALRRGGRRRGGRDRLSGRAASGVHARRNGRRLCRQRGGAARDHEKRAEALARRVRCWWRRASRASRRSNTRSCATRTTRRSPSATWRISTRSACTPATRSSSRPSQTLTNKEYHMLRDSALKIIRALKIEGGCNVQFALDPQSFRLLSHRGQPPRVALVGAGVQGQRLSDRARVGEDRGGHDARRDPAGQHARQRLSRRWTMW